MINEKKQHVSLNSLKGLTGTFSLSLDATTNQLKLTKTKAAETAKVLAEITPPVPSHREDVGQRLTSVEFSGVLADAMASDMGISIDIYKTMLGNANATTPSLTIETTGVPTELGEFTVRGMVSEEQVDSADSKYYAVLSAACVSNLGMDIRGVTASYNEIDDSRM